MTTNPKSGDEHKNVGGHGRGAEGDLDPDQQSHRGVVRVGPSLRWCADAGVDVLEWVPSVTDQDRQDTDDDQAGARRGKKNRSAGSSAHQRS